MSLMPARSVPFTNSIAKHLVQASIQWKHIALWALRQASHSAVVSKLAYCWTQMLQESAWRTAEQCAACSCKGAGCVSCKHC